MPTIQIVKEDVERLVGKNLKLEELEELLWRLKIEVEGVDVEDGRTIVTVEIGDTNRPDLWSAEGIARAIRGLLGRERGVKRYAVGKPLGRVLVEAGVDEVRPYIACAAVKGVHLGKEGYEQLIQLQEKLMQTYGRRRRKVAIGTSNLSMIRFPVHYRAVDPHSVRFVPLYEEREMDLAEILEHTEKGREYAFILEGKRFYPILLDDEGKVISFPPIINSNDVGRLDERSTDIFVDVTGTDWKAVNIALNVIVSALAERGGKVYALEVVYKERKVLTPDLTPKRIEINAEKLISASGLPLKERELKDLLERSGYSVTKRKGVRWLLDYPPYRGDIMHWRDVLEDVLMAYDYNKIEPVSPPFHTVGALRRRTWLRNAVVELLVGVGAQQLYLFTLTSPDVLKKAKAPGKYVELENALTTSFSVVRNALLPTILDFLGRNRDEEYPQKVFEVGEVVVEDKESPTGVRTRDHVAYAHAGTDVTFTDVRRVIEFLLRSLGVEAEFSPTTHPTFIPGRTAAVRVKGEDIGIVGEIHPSVLTSFELEVPVSAFELDLDKLAEVVGWTLD